MSSRWAPQPPLADLCAGGQSPAESHPSERARNFLRGVFRDRTDRLWAVRRSGGPSAPRTPAPAREPHLAELWSHVLAGSTDEGLGAAETGGELSSHRAIAGSEGRANDGRP